MVLKSLEKAIRDFEEALTKERKKVHNYVDNVFTNSDAKEIMDFCGYILNYKKPYSQRKIDNHLKYSPKEVAELRDAIYQIVDKYSKGAEFTTEEIKKKMGLRGKYSRKRISAVLNNYDSVKYTGVNKRTWIKKK